MGSKIELSKFQEIFYFSVCEHDKSENEADCLSNLKCFHALCQFCKKVPQVLKDRPWPT